MDGIYETVSNLNAHNSWQTGIVNDGNYNTIEYCVVWASCQANNIPNHPAGGWGQGITTGSGPSSPIVLKGKVLNNVSYNNWGEGIGTYNADGTILEGNVSYDNYSVNIYLSNARNVLCQGNMIYTTTNGIGGPSADDSRSTNCGGLWIADEVQSEPLCTNYVVINNFIRRGDFDAYSWTQVTNAGLNHCLIANNTLVNCPFAIGSDPGSGITNTSSTIANNVFFADSGNPWNLNSIFTGLSFSNNCWSKTPPAGVSGGATDVITNNPHLWRTGSVSPGLLTSNYFRLLANSPCINKGAVLAAVTNDYFLTLRGSPPDIGGYEYVAPVANPDSYSVSENSTNTFNPLANDSAQNPGGSLSLVGVSPTNGTASISGANVIFTPALNFIGTVTIGYTITDNVGGTNTSLITVTVTNVPPVANPDSYSVSQNTTNTFSPLANDVVQTPGGSLSLVSVSPTNGTASISGANVIFTPDLNFAGTATIGYTITDNVGGTNTSLITVTVTAPPVLQIVLASGQITVSWTGAGTLLSSTNVVGPYTPVLNATNPYTATPIGNTFFRVQQF
jgi:hypothetical protein